MSNTFPMNLTIREKALLEYMVANTQVVPISEQSQSVLDYNIMMGNIDDPTTEENKEEE